MSGGVNKIGGARSTHWRGSITLFSLTHRNLAPRDQRRRSACNFYRGHHCCRDQSVPPVMPNFPISDHPIPQERKVSKDERGGSIQEDEKWELHSGDDGFLVTVWNGLVCGKRLGCSAKEMIEGEMRDNGFSDGVVM
ncbi:hypothetical protein DEO72_LG7g1664 [Vigna unguiculata]|uniref:Uncharacterized protein n=1 Tax=Vigna unguiculata TaxID=3917 RepID=A0A4D6MHX4_VIGUN|nr:hypothetical protein DEO72_LG7g1664 [Vigna unguiculata]